MRFLHSVSEVQPLVPLVNEVNEVAPLIHTHYITWLTVIEVGPFLHSASEVPPFVQSVGRCELFALGELNNNNNTKQN